MSEFIHVHSIDKRPVGTNLGRHIPLHMTVLHWFECGRDTDEIAEKTMSVLSSLAPIAVKATAEDLFGPEKDIRGMKLDKDPHLVSLHTAIMSVMEELAATFDARWTGASRWNPHVTHQQDSRLFPNDMVVVSDIDLITREHSDGDRTILQRFTLGS